MVKEGVLENPRPDYALALHIWNENPVGWIGVTTGPAMAASETFYITITGKGGHGAAPHLSIDPIMAAAQVVNFHPRHRGSQCFANRYRRGIGDNHP